MLTACTRMKWASYSLIGLDVVICEIGENSARPMTLFKNQKFHWVQSAWFTENCHLFKLIHYAAVCEKFLWLNISYFVTVSVNLLLHLQRWEIGQNDEIYFTVIYTANSYTADQHV